MAPARVGRAGHEAPARDGLALERARDAAGRRCTWTCVCRRSAQAIGGDGPNFIARHETPSAPSARGATARAPTSPRLLAPAAGESPSASRDRGAALGRSSGASAAIARSRRGRRPRASFVEPERVEAVAGQQREVAVVGRCDDLRGRAVVQLVALARRAATRRAASAHRARPGFSAPAHLGEGGRRGLERALDVLAACGRGDGNQASNCDGGG